MACCMPEPVGFPPGAPHPPPSLATTAGAPLKRNGVDVFHRCVAARWLVRRLSSKRAELRGTRPVKASRSRLKWSLVAECIESSLTPPQQSSDA